MIGISFRFGVPVIGYRRKLAILQL